jgi:hypothetical protein
MGENTLLTASMGEEIIFRQIGSPVLQNKVYATRDAALQAVLGDVELVQATSTGLVYNRRFDPSLVQYDETYQNEQACSAAFRRHLSVVLDLVLREFGRGQLGVEIGCGKGYFLELLTEAGADVIGFDPAYEGSNPRVHRKQFGDGTIATPPDYVILRHVLEHIPTPWTFLSQLSAQCRAGTKIYIEVPCFEWIIEHRAFYDVFYEHVNYFTLDVLRRAFGTVSKFGQFFGNQYLFLVADLSSFHTPAQYDGRRFEKLDMNEYLQALLAKRSSRSGKTFIWGAGAKGITLSSVLSQRAIPIQALIDINPAKQGMFAGGSGLPIISPQDAGSELEDADVFVMNPVYLPEIQSMLSIERVHFIPVT